MLNTVFILILFFFSLLLPFAKIDIVAVCTAIATLKFGIIPGIIVGSSKILSGIIRAHLDYRTFIHSIGLILLILICFFFPFQNYFLYPLILFGLYSLITFPLVQFFGGNLFKGIIFTTKDLLASIIFLTLLNYFPL